MRNAIRGATQSPIAYVDEDQSTKRLFDRTGSILIATYNKVTKMTYLANGRLVGKGDLLTACIR